MATQRRRHLRWKRLVTAVIAILLLCGGALLWILNTEQRIQGDWSNILPICFTALGVIFAFLAWLFPFSPDQLEAFHLPLARELVRGSFKMGDESAANFPFITAPIEDAYHTARQVLIDIRAGKSNKHGILILGEANSGKTRLALEALTQTLPNWTVLRLWPDSMLDKMPLIKKHLVVFIDDLQDYMLSLIKEDEGRAFIAHPLTTDLRIFLQKARQEIKEVVVVSTCRLENKERVQAGVGQLFSEMEVLQLPTFSVDVHDPGVAKIIADFQSYNATHIQDWDGTLGSLVLGLSTKNQEYLKIRNEPAGVVLRAMKLLTTANILKHTENLLLAVCTEIFGQKILLDMQKWHEAKTLLIQEQFITEEEEQDSQRLSLIIRKDTYFDKVITDYPAPNRPYQLIHDLVRLQSILVILKDTSGLVNLGHAFNHMKREKEALQAYERAIELGPDKVDAYIGKGLSLGALERFEEALQAHERATEMAPDNVFPHLGQGLSLNFLERYEEALQAFNRAIELDPKYAEAYHNIGFALAKLERYEEALQAFNRAIELDPKYAEAYHNIGFALAKLERREEALQAYDRAIELDPENSSNYDNKGLALFELGRYEEALQAFNRAIELDPENSSNYANKGLALFKLGRYEEALQAYNSLIELASDNAIAYFNKGLILSRLGRREEADQAYDRAIELDPKEENQMIKLMKKFLRIV